MRFWLALVGILVPLAEAAFVLLQVTTRFGVVLTLCGLSTRFGRAGCTCAHGHQVEFIMDGHIPVETFEGDVI